MPHTNIRFDLWPAGAFFDSDVSELENVISNIDSVSGKTSADTRGIDLQTAIEFATLAIATGFFAKLGADVYLHLKKRFVKVLNNPIERSKQLGTYHPGDGGQLRFYISIDKMKVRFDCVYENEKDIYKLIDKTNIALNWLDAKIKNGEVDTFTESEIVFSYVPRKNGNPMGFSYTKGEMLYKITIIKQGRILPE